MPAASATSGPGTLGAQRRSPSSRTTVAAATASVDRLAAGSWATAHTSLPKTLSPLTATPSTFPSWPTATVIPIPILKPVSTGREMKSATKPRCNQPASSNSPPETMASVDATASGSAPAGARPIAVAVRIEMVEVVLTDSGRELPSSA